MTDAIEEYQDLNLRGPIDRRPDLRAALIKAAKEPWQLDRERMKKMAQEIHGAEDVLLFQRAKDANYPAAGLTLWSSDDGYYVTNIVPVEVRSLTYAQYNAILLDFITSVVEPVAAHFDYTVETTKPNQTVEDWLSSDVATKLRLFSVAANKSTGTSHPLDERRWFAFIVAIHRNGDKLDAGRLARWLHHVEGWDEDSAHGLAGDYETSRALLAYYDEN